MALVMAGIVAYVSVNGLLTIFAGAGVLGLLFFISIEIAKIVATSAIHTYGKRVGWVYSSLLGVGVIISMVITSIGIYGFLSNSYKESFNNMTITENKIELIEGKKTLLVDSKTNINKNIELKRDRISTLIDVRNNQEIRLDSLYSKGWTTSAKRTEKIISDANDDIKVAEGEIGVLSEQLGVINDSISARSLEVIELNQNNEGAAELNTLKYLSDVTGKSMDYVMKWFILLLIIIGDPMAVLLVIVFNKIMKDRDDARDRLKPRATGALKPIEPEPEPIEPEPEPIEPEPEPIEPSIIDGYRKSLTGVEKVKEHDPEPEVSTDTSRRNFSVDIPDKRNNSINSIGTNKEIRGKNFKNIFYKRKK